MNEEEYNKQYEEAYEGLMDQIIFAVNEYMDGCDFLDTTDVLSALSIVRSTYKDSMKSAEYAEAVDDLLSDLFGDGRGTE